MRRKGSAAGGWLLFQRRLSAGLVEWFYLFQMQPTLWKPRRSGQSRRLSRRLGDPSDEDGGSCFSGETQEQPSEPTLSRLRFSEAAEKSAASSSFRPGPCGSRT